MKFKLYFSLFVVAFVSCKTLEQKCSERFPSEVTEVVTETHRMDTIITPWHSVEYLDTTVCLPSVDTNLVIKTVYKKLPPDTIVYDVVCTDTMVVYSDQAKVNWLTAELQTQTALKEDAKKARKRLMLGLLGVSLVGVFFFTMWLTAKVKSK